MPRQHAEDGKTNYSLDEMLSQLRKTGEGEGRRRRRRSSQEGGGSSRRKPKSRSSRSLPASSGLSPRTKFWSLVAIGVLAVLAASIYGFRMMTRFRVEGETFRVNVGRRVSEILGRRTVFGKFTSGTFNDLFTPSANIEMNSGELLESVKLTDLQAVFSGPSWMTNEWNLSSLFVRQGRLVFNPQTPDDSVKEAWRVGAPGTDREAPTRGFRFGISADPAVIAFDRGRFEAIDLEWPGPDGKPMGVYNLRGSFGLSAGVLSAQATDGQFRAGLWPKAEMGVRSFSVEQDGTRMAINARVALNSGGGERVSEVRLVGSADLVPTGSIELKAEMPDPVHVRHLIPLEWTQSLAGDIRLRDAVWTSSFRDGPPAELKGEFTINDLIVRVPFGVKLASALRNPKLADLEFNGPATGRFSWTPERTEVTDFRVESGNLLRMSGQFTVDANQTLSGELAIEIDSTFYVGLPGGRPSFIPEPVDGWSRIEFTISGRPGNIVDSIPYSPSSLIIPVAPQSAPPAVPGAGDAGAPPAFVVPSAPRPSAEPTKEELDRVFQELTGNSGSAFPQAPTIPSTDPPPARETTKEDIERAIRRALR